ncbi:hypothetical protein LguiA_025251 [Lonicera macranthoides]
MVNFDEHVGNSRGQIRIDPNSSISDKEDKWQIIKEGNKIWAGECSTVRMNEVQDREEAIAVYNKEVHAEASSTDSDDVEALMSDVEMDDKSVAQTEIIPLKAPIPASMNQLRLSPRAI